MSLVYLLVIVIRQFRHTDSPDTRAALDWFGRGRTLEKLVHVGENELAVAAGVAPMGSGPGRKPFTR